MRGKEFFSFLIRDRVEREKGWKEKEKKIKIGVILQMHMFQGFFYWWYNFLIIVIKNLNKVETFLLLMIFI